MLNPEHGMRTEGLQIRILALNLTRLAMLAAPLKTFSGLDKLFELPTPQFLQWKIGMIIVCTSYVLNTFIYVKGLLAQGKAYR